MLTEESSKDKFLQTSEQGSTLFARRKFIRRALTFSFGVSFIWFVDQTARVRFVRKLVLLCRLIINSPCYGSHLGSNKTEVFISLLVNLKTDQQPVFSQPLLVPAAHHSQNNRKFPSPEGRFGPIVPSRLTLSPPNQTAPPFLTTVIRYPNSTYLLTLLQTAPAHPTGTIQNFGRAVLPYHLSRQ